MTLAAFYGIFIPFLGTSLGSACVLFMKKSVHIKRVLNWKILKIESGYQARFVLAK